MTGFLRQEIDDGANKVISFQVGKQEYCIDILKVREIRGWLGATPIPFAPDFVSGVINLRGIVLPVINMRQLLGNSVDQDGGRDVVMVVEISDKIFGFLVNSVSDIIDVKKSMVQGVPNVASDREKGFVSGLISINDRMVGVLSLEVVAATILESVA
ncbi:chemotaxis signal transduction protein CheW [Acetobacter nitrogenifigens DSM 23921 = NBRC 105050]|uniref:Chemotaxis protein CheW n=1 Tax=Acetobacter nitrogenifigens DSM 23921 = NBRC 105050 TaxID=1120919 RepID=A0A511X919_9PROT|nr:chemotaxis protein CheW [Acetobacter nitrogenifigens]GBQ87170.1 chemotaxis signal transduction protein CheW [Acetobacter nitrogenifigens DSM 23921 = NBRC 105050]GEN59421.1 chemotaxis protein CheW [Acetobacter nitrogenifigens DSM 23921 = NBRC 105050]